VVRTGACARGEQEAWAEQRIWELQEERWMQQVWELQAGRAAALVRTNKPRQAARI